ncbi:MAG: alpha/beta hydrolase [Fidelibacterota bacterium]
MLKKEIIIALIICIAAHLLAEEGMGYHYKVNSVIKKEASNTKNDIFLKLKSTEDSATIILDDFTAIYLIEYSHKLLFSDYVDQELPEISVAFKSLSSTTKLINGQEERVITSIEKINPNAAGSDYFYNYQSLKPGIPEKDFHHRYVRVPVDYTNPELGSFDLYYELCSDYDESKPTVIIPTDGQRTFSQVGMADDYKEMFGLEYNTVTYEYRGMYASAIPQLSGREIDWNLACEILKSENVVKDIERIRRDLLGDEKVYILGGSGTAMMGMKYVANYPDKVKKAFLMSFFKDARGSSEAGVTFFSNFLEENKLLSAYKKIINQKIVDQHQLLFLIQRLLYYDKDIARNMILELDEKKKELYEKYTEQLGTVDFFIRSAQKYKPWSVVFMYETNIRTSLNGLPDINYPFYEMGTPVRKARGNQMDDLFDIENLDQVKTDVLLVAGTLDQVAPVSELKRIHDQLPNSKLAIFEAYHCLQASEESKQCRSDLANTFFKSGEIQSYLDSSGTDCNFIKLLN